MMDSLTGTMLPLEKLYSSVGLTDVEIKDRVQGLNARLHELINEELQVEQARFDGMRDELPEMESELETLREVLGGDGVGAKPSGDKEVLVPYHRSLTETVEAAPVGELGLARGGTLAGLLKVTGKALFLGAATEPCRAAVDGGRG